MFNRHALAGEVGPRLIENVDGHSEALHALEKVERRLEALLAEHGVSDPSELPRAVQLEILRRAMLDTAVTHFPMADLETLDHHARSLPHPAFILACERVRLATKQGSDAFAAARGVHAAVALAGFGLPVAPFDLATSRISAKPSNDIDTVLELFSADQGAFIGYNLNGNAIAKATVTYTLAAP